MYLAPVLLLRPNGLPQLKIERINPPLTRVKKTQKIARYLSQIGQFSNFEAHKTLQKKMTS